MDLIQVKNIQFTVGDSVDATLKDYAIYLQEVAECNLLNSLKGIQPEDVYKQIKPELNHIGWIFGHCAVHFHWVINQVYQKKRTYSEDVSQYFRYGTTKKEILSEKPPITFRKLVDEYLRISESSFEYLRSVNEEVFHQGFPAVPKETLLQTIKRMALHFMGHTGQIVMIRQALGNPGPSFVDGVTKLNRESVLADWQDWWKSQRMKFIQ
ncbi:MAG: hypothetical protein ACXAB9_00200 [Candidatus Thorarchaeota archaeon]